MTEHGQDFAGAKSALLLSEERRTDRMSGHRAFKELTKGHSPARKARVASKVVALESALALHALRKVRTGAVTDVGAAQPKKGKAS